MDVFNLKAILSLDSSGFDNGLNKAGATLGKVGGALKTGFSTIAKVGTVAMGAATAGVVGLTKASVESYADYEQMVGGVQKLYGNMGMSLEDWAASQGKSIEEARNEWQFLEQAQNEVMKNAENAYKTAGMSANKYMEIATSFSAALINSMDGDTMAAAEATDVAMRAISDNWNTFGGDLGMIQGAFQGFAKQNYTMLDNLKLGYGGTKQEMERLIDDANEYAESIGKASNLSMENFGDIVKAIDLIQQKQNIAGTTAREASTTISGSLGMAKAAWENLVTGFANGNADIDKLLNNLIDSVVGYTDEMGEHVNGVIDNLLPVIETALVGVSQGIAKIAPVIAEKLPELITQIAPPLIDAALQIVDTLGQALMENVPQLLDYANDLLGKLADSLANFDFAGAASDLVSKMSDMFGGDNVLSEILSKGTEIISSLVSGIGQALPELLPAAMDIISNLANDLVEQIPTLISSAVDLVIGLAEGLTDPNTLSNLINSAITLIMSLADGLIDALPKLIEAIPTIIENLVNAFTTNAPQLIVSGVELIVQLVVGLIKATPSLVKAVPQIIGALAAAFISLHGEVMKMGEGVVEKVKEGFKKLDPKEWGKDLINSFVEGINSAISKVKNAVKSVADTVKSYLHFSEPDIGPLADFHTYAPDMMKLFAEGIKDNTRLVTDQIQKSFDFSDVIADQNVNISGQKCGVVINVYGAEGQDEMKIAEAVSDILVHQKYVAGAVYA